MKRLLALLVFSLVLFFIIYPAAFLHPQTTLPDNNDTRLLAYIIGQVQDNLIHHQPLFFGHFFAPDQNALTYSDLFLTTSLITLPFRLFIHSPVAIYNLALVLDFCLTFVASFFLFDYLFKNIWITLFATLLFNLSGFHFSYLPHLQMFSLWLFCLSLYFFLRFQKENRLIFLYLFFLTFTAQLADTIFLAYLIFFAVFFLVLIQRFANIKHIFFHSLWFWVIWIFLLLPYLHLHLTFPEATRPIRDAAHFSLGLDEIFTKYHSWTITLLLLFALVIPAKAGIHSISTKFWRAANYLFCFSLLMSLGPVLKLFGETVKIFGIPIPLPYTLFYYLFPGFTGFRTPSRFIILALLAACILIGHQLQPLFQKLKTKTKFIFLSLIFSLLLFELHIPLSSFSVDTRLPSIYQEVKKLPESAVILELPVKLWNDDGHEIESLRSLYSLEHRHRRFGGFSGFATNRWINLVQQINTYGLNETNLTSLHKLGVTHIVENNQISQL